VQLTRVALDEVEALLAGHPRAAKARLAHEITALFHGSEAATAAGEAFDREVRDKELPDDLPECPWPEEGSDDTPLPNLLKAMGLVQSTSEARRAIEQGGVRLDGEVQRDPRAPVTRPEAPVLVQVGKKRVARLVPRPS